MKKRHKRAVFIFACLAAIGLAAWLVLGAFRNNLVFFFSPTQIAPKEAPDGTFYAYQIMAKHDENYMPPEAARALDQARDMNKVKNSANEAAKTLAK